MADSRTFGSASVVKVQFQAVALSRLGTAVKFVSCVGADSGDPKVPDFLGNYLLRVLDANGVDRKAVDFQRSQSCTKSSNCFRKAVGERTDIAPALW